MAVYKSTPRSLIAFFFFTAMYASIFIIFNLSPSTLFYNPKFWFAICNTLMLIITADYTSYSKDKHVQINHQEEDMKAQTTSRFVSEHCPPEVVKHIITGHQVEDQNMEHRESSPAVLEDEHEENLSVDEIVVQQKRKVEVQSKGGNTKVWTQAKAYNSEELKRESKKIMRRLETMEKHEETQVSTPEDNKLLPDDDELTRRFQSLRNSFRNQPKAYSKLERVVIDERNISKLETVEKDEETQVSYPNEVQTMSDEELSRKFRDLMMASILSSQA